MTVTSAAIASSSLNPSRWVLREALRLAHEQGWTACGAAASLRQRVDDPLLLRRAHEAATRALAGTPSLLDDRIAFTLLMAEIGTTGCRVRAPDGEDRPERCARCTSLQQPPAGADRRSGAPPET